jgi:predicted small secreted protein
MGELTMKLTKDLLRNLIKEEINNREVLLEEPVIVESSFNRIKEKVDETGVAFVVISADRHNFSRSQNDKRSSEMKDIVKNAGFPFTEIDGSWIETDRETKKEVRVVEKSIVITDEQRGDVAPTGDGTDLFNLGRSLSKKYDQDAFIFGDVGKYSNKRQIDAYDRNGNRVNYGGPWTSLEPIEKDASFWSRVRGSTFVFKEEQINEVEVEAPNSVLEAYKKTSENPGKKVTFVRGSK